MSPRIIPLILCGGAGRRLHPLSQDLPKQFLRLFADRSTFEETLCRVVDPALFERPLVVTQHDYEVPARAQLAGLGMTAEMLIEPERRNSGPAILAGAMHVAETRGAGTLILALAADHWIRDVAGFRASCRAAIPAAEAGAIVAFGIAPDHPATGYGYIAPGKRRHGHAHDVRRFIEKPDAEEAARHMRDGALWNSGNLLFRAATLLDEYRALDPHTADAVDSAVKKASCATDKRRLDAVAFAAAANRSIDYAVMEKTARAAVVRAEFDWTDIGSWAALHRLVEREGTARGRLRSMTIRPYGSLPAVAPGPEYWIVARGACRVTISTVTATLQAGEFVHLPAAIEGRIENLSESDLLIVAAAADIR